MQANGELMVAEDDNMVASSKAIPQRDRESPWIVDADRVSLGLGAEKLSFKRW